MQKVAAIVVIQTAMGRVLRIVLIKVRDFKYVKITTNSCSNELNPYEFLYLIVR